jgi:hypothetical protein
MYPLENQKLGVRLSMLPLRFLNGGTGKAVSGPKHDPALMKTVRFSSVVQKSGRPESYLALSDPAKDKELQKAVKERRVMTVFQETVGTKADRGTVGFEPGHGRQFLIFPKPLKAFVDRNIVGIKYDLWKDAEIPKAQSKAPPAPARKAKPKPSRAKEKPAASAKILKFHPERAKEKSGNGEIEEIKAQIRKAMALLEDGKSVAAFNLLKRTVEA